MGEKKPSNPWYLGGLAGCMAVGVTHPFDLIKVHLQTQTSKDLNAFQITRNVVKNNGVIGLYSGISAAMLRQATYTTTRFGLYDVLAAHRQNSLNGNLPFYEKIIISGISGFAGGIVGNPADKVNVRMQNDMKLPIDHRRNYKNVIDGLIKVIKTEGASGLMAGYQTTATRGCFMTVGQIAFYEQFKQMFLQSGIMKDGVSTHLTCSILAAIAACFITQPLDVIKTNIMNNKNSTVSSIVRSTLQEGPQAFFKGLAPAFVRLAPHTILQFVFLEQLRRLLVS